MYMYYFFMLLQHSQCQFILALNKGPYLALLFYTQPQSYMRATCSAQLTTLGCFLYTCTCIIIKLCPFSRTFLFIKNNGGFFFLPARRRRKFLWFSIWKQSFVAKFVQNSTFLDGSHVHRICWDNRRMSIQLLHLVVTDSYICMVACLGSHL